MSDDNNTRLAPSKEAVIGLGGGGTLLGVVGMAIIQQMSGTPDLIHELQGQVAGIDKQLTVLVQQQEVFNEGINGQLVRLQYEMESKFRKQTNSMLRELQQRNPELQIPMIE